MRKNARDRGVSQDNGCLGDPTSSWLFIAKHVQNGLCKEWWVEFSCFLGYHALFLFSKFKAFCGVSRMQYNKNLQEASNRSEFILCGLLVNDNVQGDSPQN
jgi:hypothetical protein